jgi:hypothetical protein
MAFLADLRALTTSANALRERTDIGATLAAAQDSLARAKRVTAAAMASNDSGFDAARVRSTATVVAARQLPMMIGMDAVVELDLIATLQGGIPVPASRTERLAPLHLARVTPGAIVDISLVPGDPGTLRLELGA